MCHYVMRINDRNYVFPIVFVIYFPVICTRKSGADQVTFVTGRRRVKFLVLSKFPYAILTLTTLSLLFC